MPTETSPSLARRLLAALERGDLDDVRELYAEDVRVWNNVSRQPLDRNAALRLQKLFLSRVRDLRFEILDLRDFPGGAVDRHILRCTAPGGEAVEVPIAIVWEYRDGRITRLYEYLDPAALAPVFA